MRWLVLLVALAACDRGEHSAPAVRAQRAAQTKPGDYVLVTDANFGYPHDGRANAARLITDPAEVGEWRRLLVGNVRELFHACGYHWQVVFGGRDRVDGAIDINQDCELFPRDSEAIIARVRAVGKQVVASPDAFIYTLVVPSSHPEPEALAALRAHGELVFAVEDADLPWAKVDLKRPAPQHDVHRDDYSSLHDQDTARIAAELERGLAALPKELGAKVRGEPRQAVWDANIIMRADVRFARGTDLARVRDAVAAFGGSIRDSGVPETYELYVVSREPVLARAKDELRKRYAFATDVIEQRGLPEQATPELEQMSGK